MRYMVDSCEKQTQEHTPNEGRIGEVQDGHLYIRCEGYSLPILRENVIESFGLTPEHAELDDLGRLVVEFLENASGTKAYADHIEEWRRGKRRLWAATYTFTPMIVIPTRFEEVQA